MGRLNYRDMQKIALIILMAVALSACGFGSAALITVFKGDSRSKNSQVEISHTGVHIVQKGETVYSIARAYGADIQSVVHDNNLDAPYRLTVGQRLKIPAPDFYIVKKGDTIWEISQKMNVSSNEIVRANGLSKPYTIFVGQKLLLPAKKGSQVASRNTTTAVPASNDIAKSSSGWPRPTLKPAEPRIQTAKSSIPQPVPRADSKFLMPVRGRLISSYGPKAKGLYNDGINIAAPRGTSVKAAENGVVAYTGNQQGGFGNLILVKHSDGYISAYAHTGEMLVKRGDKVRRGQVIAKVGSSGSVDRPQLHFQLRKGRKTLNPVEYIS